MLGDREVLRQSTKYTLSRGLDGLVLNAWDALSREGCGLRVFLHLEKRAVGHVPIFLIKRNTCDEQTVSMLWKVWINKTKQKLRLIEILGMFCFYLLILKNVVSFFFSCPSVFSTLFFLVFLFLPLLYLPFQLFPRFCLFPLQASSSFTHAPLSSSHTLLPLFTTSFFSHLSSFFLASLTCNLINVAL